jgi:hypothetical protein
MWQIRNGLVSSNAPYAGASAVPFSLTDVHEAVDTTTQTTYTFNSVNFGTADSSRVLALCIMTRNSAGTQAVSSVGFPGAIPGIVGPNIHNVNATRSEIWYANVPTGTSGTVTVTMAGANQRCAIQLYSILSPSSVAPTTTATNTTNGTVTSGSLSIPAGGASIMCCYTLTGGPATPTGSPAGFDNVAFNNNITGTQQVWSIYSTAGAVTGTQTLTSTFTGSTSNAACFAVWGP